MGSQTVQTLRAFLGPYLGLNTVSEASKLGPGYARVARNVSIANGIIGPRVPWKFLMDAAGSGAQYLNVGHTVVGMISFRHGAEASGIIVKTSVPSPEPGVPATGELWCVQADSPPVQLSNNLEDRPASFLTYGGAIYVLDGSRQIWRTDGTPANTMVVGLEQPSDPFQVKYVGTISGNIGATTLTYWASLYNENTGVEGNGKRFAPVTISGGLGCQFEVWPVGASLAHGEKATHMRFYRRNHADQVAGRLVGEVELPLNQGGSVYFDDTLHDDSVTLSSEETGPFQPSRNGGLAHAFHEIWPTCGAIYKDRALFNSRQQPGRIWFSAIGMPDHVDPDDYIDVTGDDTDNDITGLAQLGDRALIGKRRAIWPLSGNIVSATNKTAALGVEAPESFHAVHKAYVTVGPSNITGNGFIVAGEPARIFFANDAGFYGFDGSDPRQLSDAIVPTWRTFKRGGLRHFTYADDALDQILYLCNGGTAVLAYFYGVNRGDGVGAWATVDAGGQKASGVGVVATSVASVVGRDGDPMRHAPLVVGTDAGYVLIGDADSRDAHVPEFEWETGELALFRGREGILHRVKFLLGRGEAPSGGDAPTLTCQAWMDDRDEEPSRVEGHTVSGARVKDLSVRRRGEAVALRIQKGEGWDRGWDRRLGVLGWEFEVEPIGQR
jgi:hypothetical protein